LLPDAAVVVAVGGTRHVVPRVEARQVQPAQRRRQRGAQAQAERLVVQRGLVAQRLHALPHPGVGIGIVVGQPGTRQTV
jgi:hypothetical protein